MSFCPNKSTAITSGTAALKVFFALALASITRLLYLATLLLVLTEYYRLHVTINRPHHFQLGVFKLANIITAKNGPSV